MTILIPPLWPDQNNMKFLLIYVPNLRFPYKGDWHKRKLNEICLFFKGNGLSKSDLSNEGFPCILYGELYTTYKNEVISDIVSKTTTTLSNPFLSKNNDLIIPGSGEDPIDIAVARAIYQNDIILGGDLNVLRPKSNVSAAFLSYQLNGVRRYDIAKKAQGKSIVHLHNSDLKEVCVSIPTYDEQFHIVKLLTKIDEMIETQSKIIDDLVLQKKYIIYSLLESIQDNEKIMLKDILFDYNVKTAINNEYPVLSSTASGMYLQTEYFNKEAASDNTTGYKIIPRGYCTYRSMSDTGLFTFNIQNLVEKGIVSPAYPVFSANNYINEFIILYLNNASYIKKQILELKSGGTRFALPFSTLCTLKIPKIEKEKQLSFIKTITAFERKIKNEEIILNDLHQQKNYLLNNMFI